jgi:hypothetical protein
MQTLGRIIRFLFGLQALTLVITIPALLALPIVFHNAHLLPDLFARDFPAAEGWWLKLQALDRIDYNADYWRARASIMWLRGELEDARHAWERGNEMAQKLSAFGAYDFTRWQFVELRKVLDQACVAANPVAV